MMSQFSSANTNGPLPQGLDWASEEAAALSRIQPFYTAVQETFETLFAQPPLQTVSDAFSRRDVKLRTVLVSVYSSLDVTQFHLLGPAVLHRVALLEFAAHAPKQSAPYLLKALEHVDGAERTFLLKELALVQLAGEDADGANATLLELGQHEPAALPFPIGEYQAVGLLAAGGFGATLRCTEKSTGMPVVIKALNHLQIANQPFDPLYEAELLSQFEHPNIIKRLAHGYVEPTQRSGPYLVLEYIPALSLHDYVDRCGVLSLYNWLSIAQGLLEALAAVHAQGIVHRDLKPGNLLIWCDQHLWQVKLIDFGIAAKTVPVAGTIGFAAPEQMTSGHSTLSPAIDVYAFGRTTCFALLGKPEPNWDYFSQLPPKFVELLERCLDLRANQRPSIAEAIQIVQYLLIERTRASSAAGAQAEQAQRPGSDTRIFAHASSVTSSRTTPIPMSESTSANSESVPKKRALVVHSPEDNPQDLRGLLTQWGWEVVIARSAHMAELRIYQADASGTPFDAILIAARLIDGLGVDLCQKLRERRRYYNLILYSGFGYDDAGVKSSVLREQRVTRLLIPFRTEQLQKALGGFSDERSSAPCAMPARMVEEDEEDSLQPSQQPPNVAVGLPPGTVRCGPIDPPPESAVGSAPGTWGAPDGAPTPPAPPAVPMALRPTDIEPPSPAEVPAAQYAPPRPSPAPPVGSSAPGSAVQGPSALEALRNKLRSWWKPKQQQPAPPLEEREGGLGKLSVGSAPLDRTVALKMVKPREVPRTEGVGAAADPIYPSLGRSPQPAPAPQQDEVDCTVYSPPEITAGDTILIQALVHLPEQAELAQAMALQADDSAVQRGARTLDLTIDRGAKLAFQLTAPGLEIDDPAPRPIIWRGRPDGVQFAVSAPIDTTPRNVIATVLVLLESVPIGQIKFKLAIQAAASAMAEVQGFAALPQGPQPTPPSEPHRMSRYEMVFISYASPDRDEVLKRVQMLKRFNVRFFQDVLNLEPGERWEQSLYKHIDESDLFLLFWSSAAKSSIWVREEVRYALQRREASQGELPEIVPIVLEGPPVPVPHDELAHLHFNDQILHFVADRYRPMT